MVSPDGLYNPSQKVDGVALELLGAMARARTATAEHAASHQLHAHLYESTFALWLGGGVVRSAWPVELPAVPLTPGTYWTELP